MEITKKQKLTQVERILNFLEIYGFIDRKKAWELGIVELPARINNLEAKGHSFERIRKTGKSRFGYTFSYVEYRLKQYDTVNQKGSLDA